MVSFCKPLRVVRFGVCEVECLPTLRSDLKGADIGLAAIGFVSWHHGQALVMNLQILGIRQIELLSRWIVGYILFERMSDQRQAAGFGACRVDDAHPVGVGLSVERSGVVVDAI